MKSEMKLLETYNNFIGSFSQNVVMLISDTNLQKMTNNFEDYKKTNVNPGFNLFCLISDIYYRENFHSDIIKSILSPIESHNEGNKFLIKFLEYLKSKGINIDLKDFSNPQVLRERGRIDILIIDVTSNKAIIIENKINGFYDMTRQIPRYYEYVENKNIEVIAVVYLVLKDEKMPNMNDWSKDEIEKISKKIVVVPAYNESRNDLYKGWISVCERDSSNIDSIFVLRQYGKLLKYLGGNTMNKELMEKFFEVMIVEENYKTALSLKNMIEELANYRVERIIDNFVYNTQPFMQVKKNSPTIVRFENVEVNNGKYAIDVIVEIDKYKLQFWDTSHKEGETKQVLQDMGMLNDFSPVEYWFEKVFLFPKEEYLLYEFINNLKSKLKEHCK